MPGAIEYIVDCEAKKITVRWKVLLTGTGSSLAMEDSIRVMFNMRFNPTPPFKIGDCEVKFELDLKVDEDKLGRQFDPALRDGDRDIIDIDVNDPGGGGHTIPDGKGQKRTHVRINPDENGRLVEWKAINELGHGLGVEEKDSKEWNLDYSKNPPRMRIENRHIEEMLNKAPNDTKREINRCCGGELLRVARDPQRLEFPDRPFEGQNPRDAAWEIFPPGSGNPFAPGYEEKMKRWQELVRRYGLTEAYRRWQERGKKSGGKKKGKKRRGTRRG